MKPAPASITCTDLTLRFPVYGVDAKSLKKALVRVAVGGRLGRHSGVTDVTALQSVSLKLQAGDRLGLIGHNGSGKTTLLRALSGAYEPDEGSIEVQGRIAALLDLGLGIDPSATGYENIRLRGRIAGLTEAVITPKRNIRTKENETWEPEPSRSTSTSRSSCCTRSGRSSSA